MSRRTSLPRLAEPTAAPVRQRTDGVALVTVMIVIVLMTVLVVGFLLRAGTERTAAANFNAAALNNLLVSTTVNLVESQINEATNPGTVGSLAWASQPGAVRTFDTSGTQKNIYRLYSAASLTSPGATAGTDPLAVDLPPTDWASSPAQWTDLNAPVFVPGLTGAGNTSLGNAYPIYPILDPRDPKNPSSTAPVPIDGFSIDANTSGASLANPCMPVRWLYVLQNGQIAAPDSSTATTATVSAASASNPIVGRIAFWTDDETCKVNVNTAAGSVVQHPAVGSSPANTAFPGAWQTPHFRSADDVKLFGQNQPIVGEYQRYPGHPATTRLYDIFNGLGVTLTGSGYDAYPYATASYSPMTPAASPAPSGQPSALFALLPRYNDDFGSRGGTVNTTFLAAKTTKVTRKPSASSNGRLYTSLGEMLYNDQPLSAGATPTRNSTGLTRQQLETGKFFLTAHSRAPETNLFGTPRVSMWPVPYALYAEQATPSTTPTTMASAFDRLAAFCATTGPQPQSASDPAQRRYYFFRQKSRDPDNDATLGNNYNLFTYLYALTSGGTAPGFTGGTLAAKYEQAAKYPTAWYQVLAEMIDYVRCTNLYDHSLADESGTTSAGIARFTEGFGSAGAGQAVALRFAVPGNTTKVRGLGRIFTFSEAALVLIATADGNSAKTYLDPVSVAGVGMVSPVVGSANDAWYVSNLPVNQYLRDSSNKIVDKNYATITSGAGAGPFPANQTLADTYPGTPVRLSSGNRRVQAMLVFEANCPMMNFGEIWPDYQIKVSGMDNIAIGGKNPFPSGTYTMRGNQGRVNDTYTLGGLQGFRSTLAFCPGTSSTNKRVNWWSNPAPTSGVDPNPEKYYLISNPFTLPASGVLTNTSMQTNGPVTVTISVPVSPGDSGPAGNVTPVQTFVVNIPQAAIPTPDLLQTGLDTFNSSAVESKNAPGDWWGFDVRVANCAADAANSTGNITAPQYGLGCVFRSENPGNSSPGSDWTGNWRNTADTTYASKSAAIMSYQTQPIGAFLSSDVVRGLVPRSGDVRLLAAKETVTIGDVATATNDMVPSYGWTLKPTAKMINQLMLTSTSCGVGGCDLGGTLVSGLTANSNGFYYSPGIAPKVPTAAGGTSNTAQKQWDWDNGLPTLRDGAYTNKPDEGDFYAGKIGQPSTPYYDALEHGGNANESVYQNYFTPNRIINSPVMFGSLPTGVADGTPWRTLLFRPMYTGGTGGVNKVNQHDALGGPPDYLALDLFDMPVVEPYAISEPFSTAGKVNMNYQIAPFTYITRNSAVRAVLGSVLMAQASGANAIAAGSLYDTSFSGTYKGAPANSTTGSVVNRFALNLSDTNGSLRPFKERFAQHDLFRSPAEICDIYLTPSAYNWTSNDAAYTSWYGTDFLMVGDNERERPYADIYPRLTTKSNTFTVHYRVQTLKNPGTKPTVWNETGGAITGEYRGSTTIERYIDPARSDIPDYSTASPLFNNTSVKPLDAYYQWRVVENRRFAP